MPPNDCPAQLNDLGVQRIHEGGVILHLGREHPGSDDSGSGQVEGHPTIIDGPSIQFCPLFSPSIETRGRKALRSIGFGVVPTVPAVASEFGTVELVSGSVADARSLAEAHLAVALPRRWRHVQGVARQGERIAHLFGTEGDPLVAACWLHDIGYAPALATTGFHPLDGANALCRLGWDDRTCALVARHSCAIREAELRGVEREVSQFPDEGSELRDALWFCDMTTSPDGEPVTVEDRLSEILVRYGEGSIVYDFIVAARDELLGAVERTLAKLEEFGSADVWLG